MDFFKRVFTKSDSKPNLNSSTGSNGDEGLFGGLEVNDTDPGASDTNFDHGDGAPSDPQAGYESTPLTFKLILAFFCSHLLTSPFIQ